MGNFTSRRGHPQPTLIPFYKATRIYLTYESLMGVLWIIHMLVIKFKMNTSDGAQFRIANEANLFHFTAPISMWAVVQQTANDNSVSWWAFIPIFVSFGRDVSSVLNIAVGHLQKTPGFEAAWNAALAENILHIAGTLFGLGIYLFVFIFPATRPRDLPTPVAFRKGKLRRPELPEGELPLLLDENKKL